MTDDHAEAGVLGRFLLLSYLLVLLNAGRFLPGVAGQGPGALAFGIAVLLTYGLLYLSPAALGAFAAHLALGRGPGARLLARLRLPPRLPARAVAVILAAAVQFALHADSVVHGMFGFHFNGFVWNLVSTPGGIESMGADPSMTRTVALIGLGFLLAEVGLLWAALRWRGLRDLWERRARPRTALAAGAAFVVLAGGERLAYGFSDVYAYRPVLRSSAAFPLYQPVRFRAFAKGLGIEAAGPRGIPELRPGADSLRYPRVPLEAAPGAPRWNVVWLVAESLRADMLDPGVMPATSRFAAGAADFRNHFSGGNGTRMGMFSMFYGLYGPYWFPFLQEQRGPALLDFLAERGYDLEAFTSAKFTYPEMDKTVFARVPPERRHEGDSGLLGWENDRRQVGALLDSIDRRGPGSPFFRFLFFESPHARYYFPEECVIRRPYAENMDYAALDPRRDIELIRNRYVNSCRHLDTQFERVFRGLEERGLLDQTIVIVTGDHGEEFLERGRWGHHSGFNRFQTLVPLVIRAPGLAPARVERMTSHLDLPATVLGLLGLRTPAEEYSLGFDLFGPRVHRDCVISGWDDIADRDAAGTLVAPMGKGALAGSAFFGPDDRELAGAAEEEALRGCGERFRVLLQGLARFRR